MKEFGEDQYAEYKETFKLFDKKGCGTVSAAELGKMMESFGVRTTPSELQEIIKELGTTGKDAIDFDGFLSLMLKQTLDTEKEFQEAFNVFDQNGDGCISAEELKEVMISFGESVSDKEIAEIFNEMDLDGDGKINYADFVTMMKGK